MKKKLLYIFALLVLAFTVSLPIILPYFKTGFFPTHDGEWAVVRLSDMYREVKDLQFPPRISGYLNFEYGYPLFNFAYPMPYYLGLFFVFLKLGFVNAVKILFSLSVIFSFLSMFFLSKTLWKNNLAGFVSGILYIYVPYRIVDLFVRGSLGESLAFVLFPLILLGIRNIYEDRKIHLNIFITGFLFALLIMTHNIMAVLFGLIILFILIAAVIGKKFKFVYNLFSSLFYSFCISAFFWIPAIFEKNLILLSKIPIADRSIYFVNPIQLFIPKWGYGVPTDANGFGYQIGIPQIVIVFLVLVMALVNRNKESKRVLFFVFIITLLLFLLFSPSAFIWNNFPLLSEINYPWTILAIIAFLSSLVAGYLTKLGKTFIGVSLLLCVISVILIIPNAKPQYQINRGDNYYLTNQATTTSSNELMPLWVKEMPNKKADDKVKLISGQIENLSYNSKKISFAVNLPKRQSVTINNIYYPGWIFSIDKAKTQINYNNKYGVMEITVPSGKHVINGKLTETSLRLFSDVISLLSVLLFPIIFLFYKKRQV